MTATQAPPATEDNAGRVVESHSVRRRTNLLSTLKPAERRAFLQEQLDQSAIFRQIACAKNGVVGPVARNIIGDGPSDEEVREESTRTGFSEKEVRRREEIARREAMIEVREEVIRQQEEEMLRRQEADEARRKQAAEEAKRREEEERRRKEAEQERADAAAAEEKRRQEDACCPVPQPAPDTTGMISEEEAEKREELARKEAALAAREEELRRQADAAAAAAAAANAQPAPTPPPPPPASPPPTAPSLGPLVTPGPFQPKAKKPFWDKKKTAAAGIAGGGLIGLLAWFGSGMLPDRDTPETETPAVTQPVDPDAVNSDKDTLSLLKSRGLAAPRTPLGEKILEAFQKDPALRERVMKDVEKTLLSE